MRRYIYVLLFALLGTLSCSKDKLADEKKNVGEVSFKVDNVNLKFDDLSLEEAYLDYGQGRGKRAFGTKEVGAVTYKLVLDLKYENSKYAPHKFVINKITKKIEGVSALELHYANLTEEINTTNFLMNSEFKGNRMEGTFSGNLISADDISPVLTITEGKFQISFE